MNRNAEAESGARPVMDLVPTPVGAAGVTWYAAHGPARAVALLGHGSATGVEAPDLQALAGALPRQGVSVALVTQPYRLGRSRISVLPIPRTAFLQTVCRFMVLRKHYHIKRKWPGQAGVAECNLPGQLCGAVSR